MDIVGEFLDNDKDTSIYRYFKTHCQNWFRGFAPIGYPDPWQYFRTLG